MEATLSTPHLKFYICRWSQLLLMFFLAVLCVFQMYALVISYSPVKHVPLSSKQCGSDHLKFSVDLTNARDPRSSGNKGELGNNSLQETYEDNNNFQTALNMTLELDDVFYPPGYFFHHNNTLKGCPCLLKTCIIKCCPINQRFVSRKNLTCTPEKSASTFKPFRESVFSKLNHHQQLSDLHSKKMNESDFFVIVGERCDKNKGKYGSRYDIKKSFIMEDGTVLTDQLIYLDLNQYCMDGVTGTEKMVTVRCVENNLDFVIRQSVTGVRYRAVIGVLIISIVSLLVTILVYWQMPELQNLHSQLLICYLFCLVIYYCSFLIREFFYGSRLIVSVINYLLQFSFLGWSIWMTIMCYNIWWVFSRPLRQLSTNSRTHRKQFTWFCVFGWGGPILACALTAAVGVVPNLPNADSCDKPRFEDDPCFFNQTRTTVMFLYYLLIPLLFLNFVMFLSTIFNLRCLHFQNRNTLSSSQSQKAKEGIFLYIKLSLSMGFNWLLPMFFFSFSTPFGFFLGRIIESSQGIVLFIVLVLCNKRIMGRFRENWISNNSFMLTFIS